MRHRKTGRNFGRESSHRRAMFRNMCISLIEHEIIKTTLPKAKEIRRYIEPLITISKTDSVANRRLVFSRLGNNKIATTKLFEEFGTRSAKRPGGYVRVLKCGFRHGDSAPMAYVEWVDRELDIDEDSQEAVVQVDSEAKEVVSKKAEPKADAKKAEPKADAKKAEPKADAKKVAPKADAKKAEPKADAKKVAPKADAKKAAPKPKDDTKDKK